MKYRRIVVSRTPRDRGIEKVHAVNAANGVDAGAGGEGEGREASLTPGNAGEPLGRLNAREFHTILRNIFFSYGRKCCERVRCH